MSGNVVGWVYEHFPVRDAKDRTRKIVLSEVAEAANRDFEHAHPGVAKLCAHWHFSRSTVNSALAFLVADGWLEVEEQGGGRGHATVYRVRQERVRESRGSEEKPRDSERETARFCDSSHISHPSNSPARTPSLLDSDPLDDEFTRWWESYPARKGSKKTAQERYVARRRARVSAEELSLAVKHYASEREGEDPKFTMHAATFLGSGERWREYLGAPEEQIDPMEAEMAANAAKGWLT